MKSIWNSLLLSALLLPPAPAEELADSGMGWRTVRLDLEIRVDPDGQVLTISGESTLELEIDSSRGPSLAINSRGPVMEFLECEEPAGAEVRRNATVITRPALRLLEVRFPHAYSRGDRLVVPFRYQSSNDRLGDRTNKAQQIIVGRMGALASWVEGWHPFPIPRVDRGEGFSSQLAQAEGTTRFHLPTGWRAVTNGDRIERQETDDGVIETWETDIPVARSFTTGPYLETRHEQDGRSIRLLLLDEMDQDEARLRVATLSQALDAMEKRFGPYPYPSYAIVEIPSAVVHKGWGASSEQGFIMASEMFVRVPGGNLPLFAHEAAHGWWGNMLDPEGPGSILLSESLAQYGAVVAIEGVEGPEAATAFLKFSRAGYVADQCARGYFDILRRGDDIALVRLQSGGIHHTLADAKAHWVYHMLRGLVGDELFFSTLRDLLARARDGETITLAKMRRSFAAAAPDREVVRFFSDWLDRPGAPLIEADWKSMDEGTAVELTLSQVQPGPPYRLELELGLLDPDAERTLHTVTLAEREQRFVIDIGGPLEEVELDPFDRLLIWQPEYGARPETTRGTR